jgi:hypothetical protein
MPKRTKKLLVYLDQNFISEMAKGPINEGVKPGPFLPYPSLIRLQGSGIDVPGIRPFLFF